MFDPKVIVALDYDNDAAALDFVSRIDPSTCNLKVGKELFTVAGPQFVSKLVALGFRVFLDLKFHDIPNTTAHAVRAAASLGVWMVDVHASGGRIMMEAVVNELDKLPANMQRPLVIGVTVLTSMDQAQMQEIGLTSTPQEQVLRLAKLAKSAGLNGVVSSAQEAAMIKKELGSSFINVTPGIRPSGSDLGDQKRVMTPAQAIAAGADYLVIGRPITKAADPCAVLKNINHEIYQALAAQQ
ncbi:MAG: orotidine-5'-phosphate decarboxylase [Candidatus Anaerobiospirillum pullicola]|uniref:Orotidine 5'-phosphate decarboxylase n=1 Tax=Candidatus Anaerobiospirillum pullicola TaxID=2838451 RepID=A0A948THT5_9GAMM|nr:orotidine-5'-phosphate decarboxylase [Candidatus Anaerobiospirillum pullicola]